jgi:hypothetical protein
MVSTDKKGRFSMVRGIWFIVMAFVLVCVTGCATPLTVDYDYDTTYDFTKLRTYDWLPSPPSDQMEDMTEKRFQGALNTQLQAKGYSRSTESPDFLLSIEGIKKTVQKGSTAVGASISVPVGSHGSVALGGGKSKPRVKQEGELTVMITERASGTLLWKGIAAAEIIPKQSPEEQQQKINAVIAELLKNFPPKPAR